MVEGAADRFAWRVGGTPSRVAVVIEFSREARAQARMAATCVRAHRQSWRVGVLAPVDPVGCRSSMGRTAAVMGAGAPQPEEEHDDAVPADDLDGGDGLRADARGDRKSVV